MDAVRRWHRGRKDQGNDWSWGVGQGTGAEDAAWTTAFRAEVAVRDGRHHAELLVDCTRCYEMVPLADLPGAARRQRFPGRIAAVAIRQYGGPRVVSISGSLSRPMAAQCGIVAGCGFARSLLEAHFTEPAEEVQAVDGCKFRLYVDDDHIEGKAATRSRRRPRSRRAAPHGSKALRPEAAKSTGASPMSSPPASAWAAGPARPWGNSTFPWPAPPGTWASTTTLAGPREGPSSIRDYGSARPT